MLRCKAHILNEAIVTQKSSGLTETTYPYISTFMINCRVISAQECFNLSNTFKSDELLLRSYCIEDVQSIP